MTRLIKLSRNLLFFMSLFFFLCTGTEVLAQKYVPNGSYKDTCRMIQVLGGNLVAQCQKSDGTWQNSSLIYNSCKGDIGNVNGVLTFMQAVKPEQPIANPPTVEQPIEKPGVEQPIANVPPEGSCKNNCKNIRLEGEYLRAECEKKNGGWKDTKIKYERCSGRDIKNINGTLTCLGKPQ